MSRALSVIMVEECSHERQEPVGGYGGSIDCSAYGASDGRRACAKRPPNHGKRKNTQLRDPSDWGSCRVGRAGCGAHLRQHASNAQKPESVYDLSRRERQCRGCRRRRQATTGKCRQALRSACVYRGIGRPGFYGLGPSATSDGTFGQDPNYKACASKTDCTLEQPTDPAHICVGERCVIGCSASGTNGNCSALPNSVCVAAGNAKFCGFAQGVVCAMGDCGGGLYQCQGTWDGNSVTATPGSPVSLFEITDTSSGDGDKGAANYDVSNNSGYNGPIKVDAPNVPGGGPSGNCYSNGCVIDLNTVCPELLQTIQVPAGTQGPISCGGAYCQSGACGDCPSWASPSSCINGKTCITGCNAPTTQCGPNAPAGLECNTVIPDSPGLITDGSTYFDMYAAANKSGNVDPNHIGAAMFSGNQGTPTCWGTPDCPIGDTVNGRKHSNHRLALQCRTVHEGRSRGNCTRIRLLCDKVRYRKGLWRLSRQRSLFLCRSQYNFGGCLRSRIQSPHCRSRHLRFN